MKKGAILVDHTTASAIVAREVHAEGKGERHRLRRRPGLRRPGRRGQRPARHHVRRRAGDLRQGEAGARRLRQDVRADRRPGRRPAHQDGQPDLHRRHRAGARRGARLRQAQQPRPGEGHRRDLQGRGAVLADGEPLEADERAEDRGLRLRHRVDAQGHRHLPGAGEAEQRPPAGHRAGRPVLRRASRRAAASAGTAPPR